MGAHWVRKGNWTAPHPTCPPKEDTREATKSGGLNFVQIHVQVHVGNRFMYHV